MQTIDEHIEFVENNKQCSYFDNEISDIRYKFMQSCSESEYQGMLEHGWRRFGKMHFVPECAACTKCISMRIDVKKYVFSKSEKIANAQVRKGSIHQTLLLHGNYLASTNVAIEVSE